MAKSPTTRAQVSGYRFLLRRLKHALLRRDPRMLHDPMRSQSQALIVGGIFSALITAAFLILSVLKPAPNLPQSKIFMSEDTGSIYVQIKPGIYNPVLNLASAELIAGGKYQRPVKVRDAALKNVQRGPLTGIIGGPSAINQPADPKKSAWSICDENYLPDSEDTNGYQYNVGVVIGQPVVNSHIRTVSPQQAILVSNAQHQMFLIYNAKKLKIDTTDSGVRAFFKQQYNRKLQSRFISEAVLNSIPAGDPIVIPRIKGIGSPSLTPALAQERVGKIIVVSDLAGNKSYYVILRHGIQKVSHFAAQLIQVSSAYHHNHVDVEKIQSPDSFITMSSSQVMGLPQVPSGEELPVQDYPPHTPELISNKSVHTKYLCASWSKNSANESAHNTVIYGDAPPVPDEMVSVPVVTAHHDGVLADRVYIPPVTGEFVVSTGLSPDSERKDSLYYVSDTGVKYGIGSFNDAAALGLHDRKMVPWAYLKTLPNGPVLSRENALVLHEGAIIDSHGVEIHPQEHMGQ